MSLSLHNTLRVVGELKNVFELKAIDDYTVQILTDPWIKESAIWELTIDMKKLTRPTTAFQPTIKRSILVTLYCNSAF
jgi:hypothetical protein